MAHLSTNSMHIQNRTPIQPLLLLLLLLSPPSSGKPSYLLDPIGLEQHQIDELVDRHNYNRRLLKASNMCQLKWDPHLADLAQKHANLCSNRHGSHESVYGARTVVNGVTVGENMWGGTNDKLNMSSVANVWYNEGDTFGCTDPNWQCCDMRCAHFSQAVWHSSRKIGCGMAKCTILDTWIEKHNYDQDDDLFKYYQVFSIVCYYSPTGNFNKIKAAERAKNGGDMCSQCEGDFKCVDGLCEYEN